MFRLSLLVGLLVAVWSSAEEKKQLPPKTSSAPAAPARARLDAAARRNENVQVNRIDNDAIKEANIRLGDNVTIVSEPPVELNHYATEHGRRPCCGSGTPSFSSGIRIACSTRGRSFRWAV